MSVADTLIHIDETLDAKARDAIETELREVPGVISSHFNPEKEHMLLVAFDPADIRSYDLLRRVRNHGYHAELIGL
jgi:hypothetical protein